MDKRCVMRLTGALILLLVGIQSLSAAIYTGGSGACYAMTASTNDAGLFGFRITISTNRSYIRGFGPIHAGPITVTDDPEIPTIKSGIPIVLRIPSGLTMTWDDTDTAAIFGGSAAGKAGTISYSGLNKHLVIAITNDFVAGDNLTVNGVWFKNYVASGTGQLGLDYNNDGDEDVSDTNQISVVATFSYGGAGDGSDMDTMVNDTGLSMPGTIFILQ